MRRLFVWPRAVPVALALAFLCALPALVSGWFLDDYLYLAKLAEGDPATGLYRLTAAHGGPAQAILHGDLPWWFDTSAKVELCRPLSGLLFALDARLFANHLWLAHLHSFLWFALFAVGVALLFGRMPAAVASLAMFLFVLDDSHWQAIGWLSNRHAVVASAPVVWGLLAHIHWRERGAMWGLPLSLAGYTIGLLGGETALQALAYLVAYEILLHRSIKALIPAGAVVAVYLVAYRALGYGAHGHEQYLDPLGEPGRFLAGAASRLPTLLADLLAGFPADLWPVLPALRPIYVVVGIAALAIFALLLRAVWPYLTRELRRELTWLSAGALVALIPGLAGLPGSRLLLMPSIGGAAVIATLLLHLGPALRRRARILRAVGAAARAWLVVVNLIFAPVGLVFNFVNLDTVGRATERMAREAEVEAADPSQVDVAVLYAPDLVALLYPPQVRALDAHLRTRSWWTLSIVKHDQVLVRTGERSFELTLRDGEFFEDEWERLFRARRAALHPGDRVKLAGLEAEIISPSKIAFSAAVPLEDPSLRLLVWSEGKLRRVQPPPIGGTLYLPRSPGLLGL